MAAIRVFSISELAEDIILRLHPRDILRLQRTCRVLRDTINDTPAIQELLFMKPTSQFGLIQHQRPPPHFATIPTVITENSSDTQWSPLAAPDIEIRPIENPFLVLLSSGSDAQQSPRFCHKDASWRRMLVTQPPVNRVGAHRVFAGSNSSPLVWIRPIGREPVEEVRSPRVDLEADLVACDGSEESVNSTSDLNRNRDYVTLGDLERELGVNMLHNVGSWWLWKPFEDWNQLKAFAKCPYDRFDEMFLELELDCHEENPNSWKQFETQLRH